MIDVPAALSLLLANAVLIVGGLAVLETRRRTSVHADRRCFVCSAPDPETTRDGDPVCADCEREHFQSVP